MNNPNGSSAPLGLPPLLSLVKPEQIPKLVHFNDAQKASYTSGVTKLWEQIHSRSPDSPEYQAAYRKLLEVTTQIRVSLKRYQAEQAAHAAQQNGGRPPSQRQQQQGQQDPRQQIPQANHSGAQIQGEQQFSPKVVQKMQSQNFYIPQNIKELGPDNAASWLREAKLKYAQNLQRYEIAAGKLADLGHIAATRQSAGKTFSQEEAQTLTTRKHQFQRTIQESKDYLSKFQDHQEQVKAASAGAPSFDVNRDQGMQAPNNELPKGPQSTQQHSNTEIQGHPHTVNSAVEAARSQANAGGRPTTSPLSATQSGQPTLNQGPHSHHPANPSQQSNSQPSSAISSGLGPSSQQPHNPQPASTPQSAAPQGVRPLSHQAAMAQAAQSYNQSNYQQAIPQPSTHAHPQIGNRDLNRDQIGNRDPQNPINVKMPIPKDLKVPQPQPVSMGPARPTLTGGPTNGAVGSMGQPAIQKHPGYVLEGEGERVLSKKKLEELVRQVTGGSGGESEESETLSAEVEEVSKMPSPIRLPIRLEFLLLHRFLQTYYG